MRAFSWMVIAALAAAPVLAQQQQNRPRIPQPGPSATSGSDAGPFSALTDNVPPPPRIVYGTDSAVQVTPSPANDIPMRSTDTVRQATDPALERAEQEHRRAAAQANPQVVPIQGAFNGQTDERSR